jgi:hypothetical protein
VRGRIVFGAVYEDGAHADSFRAREFIVRAVPDEDGVLWPHTELLAGEQVDARVGLAQSDRAGEDDSIEEFGERWLKAREVASS